MANEQTLPMSTPGEVLTRFAGAWERRDAQAIADLFVPDPEFVNVTGLWWHTPKRIAMAHAFGFEKIFGNSHLEFVEEKVRMIGEEAAVVHGRWRVINQDSATGDTTDPRFGIFIFVMEKTGQGWKAVAAQNTDVVEGHESIAVVDGKSVPQSYEDSPTSRGL
ncbi:SgcJ/EcaC family oxidoreductase [Scrofimicrobium canadense]|nr:SgcJ/EcaC family oxidoreductase [Scrofimicrobium canadense]